MRKLIILLAWALTGLTAQAQPTTDEQLAAHYFQAGEFDKAMLYYEKLYNKKPGDFYYGYYLKCLMQLEDYKGAEKLIKKQINRAGEKGKYRVDLGLVYNSSGRKEKAQQQYQRAIREMQPNQSAITGLSRSFMAVGEFDFALETLQRGRKLMRGYYPFNVEIAGVYAAMGDYKSMIDEYLDLLNINENYLQSVQNALNRYLSFEKKSEQNDLLKAQLLRRIQRNPGRSVFSEMLIWIYVQQKDFEHAFVQARALDKRMKEQGERIFSLAQICLDNGDFDVALKCYRYIIDNKEDGFYYSGSKMGLLNVMNKKITSGNYTSEELTMLEREYYTAIAEFGHSAEAVELTRDLALLQAYYLHKTDTAMALLRSAVIAGGIKPSLQARCKLALGDILLMRNEIWDASLLYSQVEKAYKYDPLGDEAKFRNAKVAFYTGDFHWAKAKLDVLKGSTSKLIANDAMYLSLLISDNTGIDTTERPLKMFARAELLAIQNKDQLSFRVLDSINELYPHHALEDDILFQRYKIAMKKREYEHAKTFLEKLIGSYGYDILGDDATFLLAELYENKLNQPDKARELYLSLLTDYPGSLYVVQARKRFRKLRGDDPAALERDRRGGTMNDNP